MTAGRTLSLRMAALFLAAATSACVSPPEQRPLADPVSPASSLTAPARAYEQRLRERAQVQVRQGRLADAALSWEVLTALRPDAGEYRERLHETRRQIEAALPERLRRAQQAQRRGELDGATAGYLSVLALQPDHEVAADALRAIERERNRINYLGKYSRITLERRGGLATAKRPAAALDGNEVEHAALLGSQGEVDAAIALLERYLAVQGADAKACQLLADMLQKSKRADPAGARAARTKQGNGAAATASSPCP
jgi:tetratricopeptide (TPR) repeat protein